jgi:hypothetical protein
MPLRHVRHIHTYVFVDPAKLIQCSLHLEIRIGLKMSTMILAEGLNSYMVKLEQVKFIEQIEKSLMRNLLDKRVTFKLAFSKCRD